MYQGQLNEAVADNAEYQPLRTILNCVELWCCHGLNSQG